MDQQPPCIGRDSLDSPQRRSLAGSAGEISAPFDVLAARLGGAGRVVEHLSCVSQRVERAPAVEAERIVSGQEFRSGEKGGAGVGKTKRGKGTMWMVVVDGEGVPLGDQLHSLTIYRTFFHIVCFKIVLQRIVP